jgi:hypothetical protein
LCRSINREMSGNQGSYQTSLSAKMCLIVVILYPVKFGVSTTTTKCFSYLWAHRSNGLRSRIRWKGGNWVVPDRLMVQNVVRCSYSIFMQSFRSLLKFLNFEPQGPWALGFRAGARLTWGHPVGAPGKK